MRTTLVALLCLFIGLLTLQCSTGTGPETPQPQPLRTPAELTTIEKGVIASSNTFGLMLFKQIYQATAADSNIFISPLSVSYALGMAYNGAGGATRDAIAATLALSGLTPEEINSSYKAVIDILTTIDPGVAVSIANSIWYRDGFPVKASYLDINQSFFNAETRGLDFSADWACDTINGWVDRNTNGKIPDIIDPPIDPYTMLFLINAVYFKGDWTLPFDPDFTLPGRFHALSDTMAQRDFMNGDTVYQYFETEYFTAVDLFYGDSAFSMTVIVPGSAYTVDDVVAQLDEPTWSQWTQSFAPVDVSLSLPKFTFEYECGLKTALTAMGMGIAFVPFGADFSGIAEVGDLHIKDVKHKTFVRVDEEGTEAAAVTAIEFGITSMLPKCVIANRPFLVVIRERVSGAILFIGRIADPVWDD